MEIALTNLHQLPFFAFSDVNASLNLFICIQLILAFAIFHILKGNKFYMSPDKRIASVPKRIDIWTSDVDHGCFLDVVYSVQHVRPNWPIGYRTMIDCQRSRYSIQSQKILVDCCFNLKRHEFSEDLARSHIYRSKLLNN